MGSNPILGATIFKQKTKLFLGEQMYNPAVWAVGVGLIVYGLALYAGQSSWMGWIIAGILALIAGFAVEKMHKK